MKVTKVPELLSQDGWFPVSNSQETALASTQKSPYSVGRQGYSERHKHDGRKKAQVFCGANGGSGLITELAAVLENRSYPFIYRCNKQTNKNNRPNKQANKTRAWKDEVILPNNPEQVRSQAPFPCSLSPSPVISTWHLPRWLWPLLSPLCLY